jgi:alcohol dehydrogenase class IV
MQKFVLNTVPEIVFGAGRLDALGARVTALAGRKIAVMVIADPVLTKLGVTARLTAILAREGHTAACFDGFAGEPRSSDIDEASRLARAAKARCIIGLGGGSALDTAKLAASCIVSGKSAEAYQFCETALAADHLPIICVPTTAGTGSEATGISVFTNSRKVKAWAWGPELKPQVALLDPVLTTSVPPAITAATGLDALVHAIEAATNRQRNEAIDLYCHRAVSLIFGNFERVLRNGDDLAARGAMLLASTYAGIGIDNCGTALAHNISHALAALAPIAHGRATGLAMLATIDWVAEGAPRLFAAVARAMGEEPVAEAAIRAFDGLVRSSGIKIGLSGEGFGLDRPELLAEQMAAPENAPMRKSTVRPVSDDDLLMLAQRVYSLQ